MSTEKIKAVGLLSGGLDSTLAAKLLIDQGIEVHAVNFKSPFCTCTPKSAGCSSVATAIRQLGDIPLKSIALGDEYLAMIKAPKHGYGRGMNPCIDCRIMKIRRAAEYMVEIGAGFLFTGEVLGQRPMSQHGRALRIIDDESGIKGLILRPLSANALEPTVPEMNGWVDREKLRAITGRSRKEQIGLADEKGIADYPCPAGGCLLTDERFGVKIRDYLRHTDPPQSRDIPLLKVGRHFRLDNKDKVVVSRDGLEGEMLLQLARPDDVMFLPDEFSGPVTLLRGSDTAGALVKMLSYVTKAIPADAQIKVIHGSESTRLPQSQWPAYARAAAAP